MARSAACLAALVVAILAAIEPCSSKLFEPYLPSLFSSNSGSTKPQKAQRVDPLAAMVSAGERPKTKGTGGGRRGGGGPRDTSLSHVCGSAGKPWNPFVSHGNGRRRRLQAAAGAVGEQGAVRGGVPWGDDFDMTQEDGQGGSGAEDEGWGGEQEEQEQGPSPGGQRRPERRRRLLQRRGQAGYNALVRRYGGSAEFLGSGDGGGKSGDDDPDALKARLKQYVAASQSGAGAAGFNPLEKYCNMEKRSAGSVSDDEKLLISCLRSGAKCSADPERIARAANRLKGMQMLNMRPKCMFTNRRTCTTSTGNPETGLEFLSTSMKARADKVTGGRTWGPPAQDLPWGKYARCAVVGNGPSLQSSPNGGVIDRFDAVFRFNEIGGRDPLARHGRHMGHKTTFRVFARKPTFDMAEGSLRIRPQNGESWLFWHAHSRLVLPAIERKIKGADLYMFSPALVRWQLEVYFQLRRDLRRLGFGPWSCPRNINSGLHAILVGQHLCGAVGTFGISHLQRMAESGAHFGDSKHPMSRFHSWGFDTLAMRVLHLAERIRICG